jgi:PAS domain S-box-containing protein
MLRPRRGRNYGGLPSGPCLMDPPHFEAARRALFQIVEENTADMIALVVVKGRRLYNSPASKRTRGYSAAELGGISAFEQIQLDDRFKVLESGTRGAQHGHKGKSWSTAFATRTAVGGFWSPSPAPSGMRKARWRGFDLKTPSGTGEGRLMLLLFWVFDVQSRVNLSQQRSSSKGLSQKRGFWH